LLQNQLDEELLQLLVAVVDAKLLEPAVNGYQQETTTPTPTPTTTDKFSPLTNPLVPRISNP
jgi:hypothetical protein